MCDKFWTVLLIYRPVIRPVAEGTVIGIRKKLLVFRLTEKRFMGIKGLNLEKPVILIVILCQKIKPFLEGSALRLSGRILHDGSVGKILHHPIVFRFSAYISCRGRPIRKTYQGLPVIPLLPPYTIPGCVALMVGGTSVFPIMIVITD